MAKALPRGVREKNGSYEARAVGNGIRINLYGTDLNELMEEFENKNQSYICSRLKGEKLRSCDGCIEDAVRILEEKL